MALPEDELMIIRTLLLLMLALAQVQCLAATPLLENTYFRRSGNQWGYWVQRHLKVYFSEKAELVQLPLLFTDAFQQWNAGIDSLFSYEVVQNPEQADIIVRIDTQSMCTSPNSAATFSVHKPKTHQLDHVIIQVGWFTDPANYQMCILHEVGHAFGLYGHSNSAEDAMWPTLQKTVLSERDLRTIHYLYFAQESAQKL